MTKKIMTSLKLSKQLHNRLLQKIVADGYGMRGKSKWIIEAVEEFLRLPNYPELVDIASEMAELTEVLSIRVTDTNMQHIDEAIFEVRTQYPTLEGVKSNIIRASIMQRLIRSPTSVTE